MRFHNLRLQVGRFSLTNIEEEEGDESGPH